MKKIGKLIGKGVLYSLIIFHILVIVNLILGRLDLSNYIYALAIFIIFGIIAFTTIYVLFEMIFLSLEKKWPFCGSVIFKILLSTFISVVIVGGIVLICASYYPSPLFETSKLILFEDGLWIFIAYAPMVFIVDYFTGIVSPKAK